MTADSTLRCSARVTEGNISVARREREIAVRTTSRSPMRREAKREVPPLSLAEQRRISVLPQFSTMFVLRRCRRPGHLRNGLKPQHDSARRTCASAQVHPSGRRSVRVRPAHRPRTTIAGRSLRDSWSRKSPGASRPKSWSERRDLARPVRNEQHAAAARSSASAGLCRSAHPVAHRKGCPSLSRNVFQRAHGRAGDRADGIKHASVVLVEERLGGCTPDQGFELRGAGHTSSRYNSLTSRFPAARVCAVTALKKVRA